jgi:enoyl-CoA hydratase/carnithine racemase
VAMGDEFAAAVSELKANSASVKSVVVTGAGRAFSAGGDVQFLRDRCNDTPSRNAAIMRDFYERMLCLRTLPMPTICAINGHAIGAGLAFTLAADFRIAADTAQLGVTFTKLGIHPGMGSSHFLPRLIGTRFLLHCTRPPFTR